MNQSDMIRIARQSGWPDSLIHPAVMAKLLDFARLMVDEEISACAEVCRSIAHDPTCSEQYRMGANKAYDIILSRKQK